MFSQSQEETYNALNKYAKNLNQLAIEKKLDPVIGRDEETRRVLQILSKMGLKIFPYLLVSLVQVKQLLLKV